MGKARLEGFSDAFLAIIITIMVLELRSPESVSLAGLTDIAPSFLSYLLSFTYVGIYWNNHHQLLQSVRSVSGGTLWANLHLLFWLSTIPFATAWLAEHYTASVPVALYGFTLFMSAVAYHLLARLFVRLEGPQSPLRRALGSDRKGAASLALYMVGIGAAFVAPIMSLAIYGAVAALWFVPDPRIRGTIPPVSPPLMP
jgi:uncharacterized membrane protein